MSENGNGNGNGPADYANEGLDQGAPETSARPGRVLAVVGIVGVVLAFLLYNIFSSGGKEIKKPKESEVAKDLSTLEPPPPPSDTLVPPTNLPPPTGLTTPPVPTPPTALNDIITPKEDAATKQQAMARMKSKMFVETPSGLSSLTESNSSNEQQTTASNSADPNANFMNATANTKAQRVQATRIGDLNRTIAQGRIIQATMESALNTDLPAPIRAIVSRDTYGEAGREPLIPKGSRLIGTYNTDITGAQSRVFVVWTRVIRPDGVDVQIGSPLVDQIGQAGVGGQIDTKFQAIFSRSILASVVSISAAIASDEVSGGSTTTTSTGSGSTTTGDAATTATVDALNRLGGVSDNFIKRFIDVRPTILVDQGTPVNVFVNRDLVFPSEMTVTGGRIVN